MPKATVEDKAKEAEELILTYMTQQNRPFAATDVHLNLKGAVTKTAAQKALVTLADQGKLLKKEYGKTLVFVVQQTTQDSLAPEELTALHAETLAKREKSAELKKLANSKQAEADALLATPLTLELLSQVELAVANTEALLVQLNEAKSSGVKRISDEELATYTDSLAVWRKHWVTRRKAAKGLMSMLAESMDPSSREALEDSMSISAEEDAVAEKKFTEMTKKG